MKPWMWILIAAALLAVIIYGIYSWQQSAEEERELERKRLEMIGLENGGDRKVNIWALISGLSGVLAQSGVGEGRS